MTTPGTATVEHRGRTSVVTIVNPAKRNALDDTTRPALLAAVGAAMADLRTRVVVLSGADGSFCAGGELRSMPTEPDEVRARLGQMHDIVRLLHIGPKPVIAAVEGPAFGSGLSLVAACDHVVASWTATFGCTFGRVGLLADCGLLATLPGRVGPGPARTVLLRGTVLGAGAAAGAGLVDEVVVPDGALARATVLADGWPLSSPLATAATKRVLASALDAVLEQEMEEQIALLGSADFAEGRAAFLERRSPAFATCGSEGLT